MCPKYCLGVSDRYLTLYHVCQNNAIFKLAFYPIRRRCCHYLRPGAADRFALKKSSAAESRKQKRIRFSDPAFCPVEAGFFVHYFHNDRRAAAAFRLKRFENEMKDSNIRHLFPK
jgi:hypothetical protein